MSLLIKTIAVALLPIYTLVACSGGPGLQAPEDYAANDPQNAAEIAGEPMAAESVSAASSSAVPASETDAQYYELMTPSEEADLASRLANTDETDLVDIAEHDGWLFQYDRASRLTVASRGTDTLAFDMETMDDATLDALADAGLPEDVLLSIKGTLCRAACVAGATALGVAGIAAVCSVAGAITLGSATIPCAVWAGIIVGGSLAGAGSICRDFCPK